MLLSLVFILGCTATQLQSAGLRVHGAGPVNQAWILATVGCFDLADDRLDALLAQADGQHRLHALFVRGRVAVRRCALACSAAQRTRGQAALRAVEARATAPSQVEIARQMRLRLQAVPAAPPPDLTLDPAPAPRIGGANEVAPGAAGPLPVPETLNPSTGLWIGAGVALLATLATGYWALDSSKTTDRLSASRSSIECGGRQSAACRAHWRSQYDRTQLAYGLTVSLGIAALGLGVSAWWTHPDPTAAVAGPAGSGPRGFVVHGVW